MHVEMELLSAIVTLVLVMDPVGNVPVFLGYLKDVDARRRVWVVARESIIALLILLFFLFFGPALMGLLHIGPPALHISGGVLLFIISVGMIFPGTMHLGVAAEQPHGEEPFIVPLATPFIAGPSTMATIMIFASGEPDPLWAWAAALVAAWVVTAIILMLSARLSRLLGSRGLVACERLMGMILTVVAVQMFLDGVQAFLAVKA
jgi:multiple antibiotic resistance protein